MRLPLQEFESAHTRPIADDAVLTPRKTTNRCEYGTLQYAEHGSKPRRMGTCPNGEGVLAINISPMADSNDEHDEPLVLQIANQAIIPDPVPLQVTKLRSLQRFADDAWIVEGRQPAS